ncbi:hypothetical protein HYC85_017193 [Camellia sinensis]|uniref:Pentacotripeptide-repeat region of PRORP domain-containing protein n=1 Tax=Camellia sinensis TaxID=4442 RepID=A0A7J7H334_CAMSI|nr:hypothetical protein HYC85_017193 [Camellia sinensis]
MPSLSSSSRIFRPPFRTKPKPKPKPKRHCIVQPILELFSKGHIKQALESLGLLARKGIRLDSRTLASFLQECANTKSLKEGKWVHLHLKLTGLKQPNTFLSNHLINLYCKCGNHVGARKVFDKMSVRNLYSWNNMLSGYVKLGMVKPARRLFDQMPEKDVVSWNTMVIGYAKSGYCDEALRFYRDFRRLSIGFNEFSFAGVLTVCVKLKELGLSSRDVLAWTTLVSGYAKWGDMKLASELFDRMPEKNPVSWTSLIAGYARNNMGNNALELFTKMMLFQIRPDQFTFSSCLCACASIASLKHGKQIHAYLIRSGFKPNAIVVSSLIDMYSKCGCLGVGRQVFDIMGNKQDYVLWNTMISALAQHGCGEEAIQIHSGLVEEGLTYFQSMTKEHGIVPDQEHYACLVDLLGRAGCFDELMNQLDKMPCKPDGLVWNALLGVCRIHGNLELGRKAAENLIELEPQSSAAYVLLSSIYAALGKWESVEKIEFNFFDAASSTTASLVSCSDPILCLYSSNCCR